MNRGRIGAGALTALILALSVAETASAQEARPGFGNRGEFVVSAERLVPLISYTAETTPAAPRNGGQTATSTDSGGTVSLLWGENRNAPNFFTVPRVGLDYFLTDMLTLGVNVGGAFSTGGHNTFTEIGTTQNSSTVTTVTTALPSWDALIVGARVGVAFHLSDMVSIWPRGGLSYAWSQTKSTSTNNVGGGTVTIDNALTSTVSQLSLDLDPQLVISPWRHMGFTVGVSAGIPLVSAATDRAHTVTTTVIGSTTNVNVNDAHTSANANNAYVGANLGLLVYF